jgi:hypothetical protein
VGLGLYVATELSDRELDDSGAVLDRVAAMFPAVIRDPRLRFFTEIRRSDDRLRVSLHPVEEDVDFFIDDRGRLVCCAKTSSCGPGYHAFLVESLEAIAARNDWKWVWTEDEGDETSYWMDRSFEALQTAMIEILQAIARNVTDDEMRQNMMIAMPMRYPSIVDNPPYIMTQLGPRNRDWLRDLADAEQPPIEAAEEYYVWWNLDADASFWVKTGRAIAWTDLRWTQPLDNEQKFRLELVNRCFEIAHRLDDSADIPMEEWREIGTLLQEGAASDSPPPDVFKSRIGYRRHLMRFGLTGGWSIELPGYYYDATEDDHTTLVFWFKNRTVRASSWSWDAEEPRTVDESLAYRLAKSTEPGVELIDFRRENLPGCATLKRASDDGENYWLLQGETCVNDSRCLVSICFDDDADRDWAIRTWRSLRHAPAQSPNC